MAEDKKDSAASEYEALKKQQEEIESRLNELKKETKRRKIAEVKAICKEFQISAGNLRGALYIKKVTKKKK